LTKDETMPEPTVDRARTEALAHDLMTAVKAHYTGNGGASQDLVYEALNGLACSVATVVAGTAPLGVADCLMFFSNAFTQQLNALLRGMDVDFPTQPGVH
jgi:hypothetical protein